MMTLLVELLQKLFLKIYCLSGKELLACGLVGALGYYVLHRTCAHKRWWRAGSVLMLILWAAAAICSTVMGRNGGQSGIFQVIPFHSYREMLAGGNPEILRSNFMNVLLFFPAGLLFAGLLPRRWTFGKKLVCAMLICFLFSLGIELTQFTLGLGLGEADDILHNTLGALLGVVGFRLAECFPPRQRKIK